MVEVRPRGAPSYCVLTHRPPLVPRPPPHGQAPAREERILAVSRNVEVIGGFWPVFHALCLALPGDNVLRMLEPGGSPSDYESEGRLFESAWAHAQSASYRRSGQGR